MPSVIEIESFADQRMDVYRNVRDADLRGRDGLFMAESELVLRRLMKQPQRLHSLLVSHEKYRRMADAIAALPQALPVYVADLALIHEIAAFHIHRGCLAAGYRPTAAELSVDAMLPAVKVGENVLLVLAEGITNVDNMGALFRNAAAFGVDAVILDDGCCDPLYRKAIRVSMGHVFSVPYAISSRWADDLRRLRTQCGLTLIAAENADGAESLASLPPFARVGVVFGSEGHGLSSATLQACHTIRQIPMAGEASLNVAVASAIFLYELRKEQRIMDPRAH